MHLPIRTSMSVLRAMTLICGVLVFGGCASSPVSTTDTLVILHTNDFHGHIAQSDESLGAARIAAFFDEMRKQHEHVLVVDAGDAISGTPVSTLFSGLPVFEVMNRMGYDLGLLGNHEFDHGYRQIQKFREVADYPLLSANARGPNGQLLGDAPYAIIKRGDLDIGVIGVVTETTPNLITPLGNQNLSFDSVENTLRELVSELRPRVDVLVVLSHAGHQKELELASAVSGIDVIVGGHSHSKVDEPVQVNNTLVVQAHEYGKAVGVLELQIQRVAEGLDQAQTRVSLQRGYLAAADAVPVVAADSEVAQLVANWEARVSDQVDVELAQSESLIVPGQLRMWMEQVIREHTGAELAYYNRGGVRDAIRAGPVTIRSIWKVEPFGNSIVTLALNGSQVRQLLAGNRDEAGIELDDQKTYRVATNSFVGAHAVRTFGQGVALQDTGVLVRDALIQSIKSGGLPGQ